MRLFLGSRHLDELMAWHERDHGPGPFPERLRQFVRALDERGVP